MARCTHHGCGKEYDPSDGTECVHHPGAPVFHEGLKSWSCCSDTNKPVLDFDEFMAIPGCTRGPHTEEARQVEAPKSTDVNLTMVDTAAGGETYGEGAAGTRAGPSLLQSVQQPAAPAPAAAPAPVVLEEDDLAAPVPPGTQCRRNGCKTVFESDGVNREGDGPAAVCTFHPKAPLFHEGSKGYLCCKPRVLEFDEFLKIPGCQQGRHVFVPKKTEAAAEEFASCRIDHYQTPTEVHVSVFAKKADQERSTVKIDEQQLHLDLYFLETKRFRHSINLFGPVDTGNSTFKFFGTKVEITLKKQDSRSWGLLEHPAEGANFVGEQLTFGVTGRTGTIGGKELVLSDENKKAQ